jgi:hypothetical protein
MIPPLRADFANVRILRGEPRKESERNRGNYLVLTRTYARLVLNEWKSKSSRIQQYSKIFPRELERVVRDSLKHHPRTHLVVSTRTGKAFETDNAYILYVNRMFERVLGKPVTTSMLRHIYVSSHNYDTMTTGEKEDLSRSMAHSMVTNDSYRLLFKEHDCVCKHVVDSLKE